MNDIAWEDYGHALEEYQNALWWSRWADYLDWLTYHQEPSDKPAYGVSGANGPRLF